MPSCGQCNKSGAQCKYPQTFKRGFPEGYLAGLEQRLAETERALFDTLRLLHDPQSTVTNSYGEDNFIAKQNKSARLKEWERLPLVTTSDRWQWYQEKATSAGVNQQQQRPSPRSSDGVTDQYNSLQQGSPLSTHTANQRYTMPVDMAPTSHWSPSHANTSSLHRGVSHSGHVQSPGEHSGHQLAPSPLASWHSSERRESFRETTDSARTSPNDVAISNKAQTLSAKHSSRFF